MSGYYGGQLREWEGRLVRAEGEFDERSRMVNLVVEVASPYSSGSAPLTVGMFVDVAMRGPRVNGVRSLPRGALRTGDKVWTVAADGLLRVRKAQVVRKRGESIVVRLDMAPDERVVVSQLQGVTDGMKVRVEERATEMKKPVAWMARNHVAANLLMGFLLLSGFLGMMGMRKETFPEFSMDAVQIKVPYLGATPAEVEGRCLPPHRGASEGGWRECAASNSTASEGMGVVSVEIGRGAVMSRMLDDIKAEIDRIETFPDETEKPVIKEALRRNQVIDVVIYGDVEEKVLKVVAERVREDLRTAPLISQVELSGVRTDEISIEVSERMLRRHGLSLAQNHRRGQEREPGPARWQRQVRGRRDPRAHEGAQVRGSGVRGNRRAHAIRRNEAETRSDRHCRGRLRGQ